MSDVMNIGPCADTGPSVVRVVYFNGTIATLVGTGVAGLGPDTGPGTAVALSAPRAVVSDGSGGLIVTDTSNGCLRRWFPGNASVVTFAGKVSAG